MRPAVPRRQVVEVGVAEEQEARVHDHLREDLSLYRVASQIGGDHARVQRLDEHVAVLVVALARAATVPALLFLLLEAQSDWSACAVVL